MVVALKENDGSNVSHHSLNQGQRVFMTLSQQGSSRSLVCLKTSWIVIPVN